MFANFRFFETEFEKHLKLDYVIDPRISPSKLIHDLRNPSHRK